MLSSDRDAGVVLSGWLERSYRSSTVHDGDRLGIGGEAGSQAHGTDDRGPQTQLPALDATLSRSRLRVLELGAGCGILGITLAHLFPDAEVLLTDLEDAEEIISCNVAAARLDTTATTSPSRESVASDADDGSDDRARLAAGEPGPAKRLSYLNLDWATRLPEAVRGTGQSWDLVVVSDCTYNPDVVPDLVATLDRIVSINEGAKTPRRQGGSSDILAGTGEATDDSVPADVPGETLVCLAMKVRHESESVFFHLMRDKGFVIREQMGLALPVLGAEAEEILVFVFARAGLDGGRVL